ncbi:MULTISPECIES: acyltransferase family protein [Clostridium]|uniref:Unchracterized conserved protein, similar to IcaC of Staphylococcus YHJR B.subtilis family n=1 Tax=Clostridium acetobutylicum (strain ATCC 824 / DSM 792 / JCM 1419 / IAM 19013 / LMG 5710 / NBRC 13948 / NRRL B-527 / VKM B-1787 / 2291 / W) TaxID=272562 RepID=Q97J84_CLOAB|nr:MULTISPECIES: acyltransferase family protein [Clostridium]AAK79370.1 Unchracterized conserved protein, similar to IcaC of Staphylococcus; YHJR B.subtilis family [Clostridium acetobutylicum ATCC 824]ADZ20455.1 Conserved hypothetical protein [Clostridium acetobutylicum EA 2018]AEI31790.1 hypothetical protein SMB_G1427 [Clostridium acetobutylicum DSM 1731]AWV81381.1 acyltransferase [Clostridium acetobutylicum]MBC2393015.1 acyltransferase family protein [Clostridium acetobutylicum]
MPTLTFKLIFSYRIFIYLLVFVLFPILLFYNSSLLGVKSYNHEFLSKKSTDCIKGLSILVIILHHISLRMQPVGFMGIYTCLGHLAVSMFLFFSGYGLMVSKLKKKNYFKGFFSKRLSKVYLPFVIINAITIILTSLIFGTKFNLKDIIFYLSGLSLIDSTQWFVIAILVFYLCFYVCFKFLSTNLAQHILLFLTFVYFFAMIFMGFREWWYNTAFCFPLGVYAAINYDALTKFLEKHYVKTLIIALIAFTFFFFLAHMLPSAIMPLYQTIASIIFVYLVLLFLFKFRLSSKPLLFLGNIAYEIYLVHMKILVAFFSFIGARGSYIVYLYLILVIIVAFCFNKLFNLNKNKKVKLT